MRKNGFYSPLPDRVGESWPSSEHNTEHYATKDGNKYQAVFICRKSRTAKDLRPFYAAMKHKENLAHPLNLESEFIFMGGTPSNDNLTLTGDGVLELHSNERGIFAMDDVTVDSGTWIIEDTKYEGMWLYIGLTVNGGTLDVYGKDGGLYGDDYPPVTVSGGTVIARAADGYAVGWCDMDIASGATVTVGATPDGQSAVKWDGKTDFIDCSYVEISFSATPVVLLGDVDGNGQINMMDVMMLYNGVSGRVTLTDSQKAAGDMDESTIVNMFDVVALYNKVSGK